MTPIAVARHVLRQVFGHTDFRPLQMRIIHHVLDGRDVLAVLPTGAGKSICYQVPALVQPGLTLVISPLIALMQDQVAALHARGVPAAVLNSTLDPTEQAAVLHAAAAGELRLVYLSPERLPRFCDELLAQGGRVSRLAVDEAHCIAEWGHDFRPSYRLLRRVRAALGRPPCVALTGTATPDVRRQIRESLGFSRAMHEVVGSFDRPNLRFEVVRVSGRDDRLARLAVLVRTTPGAAIVYAPTRSQVEGLSRVLVQGGVKAVPYHAGMALDDRRRTLERFLADEVRVVVATSAFGMGIDKAHVQLVAHWTIPASLEAYYQEAGRAGRDGSSARCVLFHHPGDTVLPRRQLAATFPAEASLADFWRNPALRNRHPAAFVAAADRLAAELRPESGRVDWTAVRRRRREAARRIDAMAGYAATSQCRRRTMMAWFGERLTRCSGCDRCTG